MSKLDLKNELAALDGKDRDFYDSLDDSERKKFSSYILLKFAANVEGSRDLQEYYLLSANEQNKNFWSLTRHPKLQWLSLSAISPGVGSQRHYWIKASKTAASKKMQRLSEIYPNARQEELEILDAINSDLDIRDYDEGCGHDTRKKRGH
jgi:hypothetical protein